MELLLSCFLFAVGLFVFFALRRAWAEFTKKARGAYGESVVSAIIESLPGEYALFNDVYIRDNERTIQIDHVVVSIYGIFVIETKNYSGWIFGTDNAEYWTQNLYGYKTGFYNPLRQNLSHTIVLMKLLNLPRRKFFPIVVFLNKATLRCRTRGCVINTWDLGDTILSRDEVVFSQQEVEKIKEILSQAPSADVEIRQQHVDNIRRRIDAKNDTLMAGRCPRCGAELVERMGPYGCFWGCENYPNCKFTIKL